MSGSLVPYPLRTSSSCVEKRVQRMVVTGTDLQRQTLRLYGELMARREGWAGQLVFAYGEGASATGLPAAVSIAGGTSLVLDPDVAAVKSVFRQGGVDFVVNTLDEALRVLKNEIRKHRPLSVALEGAEGLILAEMRERGVLPDLHVSFGEAARLGAEAQLGMESLRVARDGEVVAPSSLLERWLSERGWFEVALERATTAEMRELDTRLVELLPDGLRRVWVQRIGHYQRVSAGGARVVWLTEAERGVVENSETV